jgi:hypothetical protein
MRCKNCGWDNPDGNVKCEKCNALLDDDLVDDRMSYHGYEQDNGSPRPTIASFTPEEFNPRATITGCASCGYPVRPDDMVCPVCDNPVSGSNKDREKEKPVEKAAYSGGTIIRSAGIEKGNTDTERKKLTGFLVTYSHLANGEFFPLFEGKNTVGRSAASNVCVKGDSAVSEKHLSILYRAVDRKFKFKDEQSSNGTFINGNLIDEGELKHFDMIRVGTTKLLFIEIPLSSFE